MSRQRRPCVVLMDRWLVEKIDDHTIAYVPCRRVGERVQFEPCRVVRIYAHYDADPVDLANVDRLLLLIERSRQRQIAEV